MDIPQIVAGRFRIEREIGRGGMGTVYRASHLGLERPVAIKVLKQEFAADPEVAERFMREARTMARLRHPRAAMIFDAGRLADGRPFIVMEYVEGSTLAETLARESTLSPERAVAIAAEICDVLSDAHALGIVHRDLKPSNIMLNERGVCVLDFGIAKVLATSTEVTRTHATTESGLVIGTPRYMSPEQCLGLPVGPASDLYSVGVLVYEMLAGRPPFVDVLSSAILVKQATSAPPPLLALRPELPRPLALAAHTLLAKNPASRPSKASEARALLERSIARPKRVAQESDPAPFASTINVINAGRYAFFRIATLCAIIAMLGTVLFVWAGSDSLQRGIRESSAAAEAPAVFSNGIAARRAPRRAASAAPRPAMLTPEAARRIASSVTHGAVSDARIVRTKEGQAIAAIRDQSADGTAHLYFLERFGAKAFRVTESEPLDIEGFDGARWTQEAVDLDGDGYDEVLCTGTKAGRDDSDSRRLVVYVPRTRQTYSLQVAPDARAANTLRATWSPNTMAGTAQPYRLALRQRAFAAPRTL
ncbi:MAG TPA: serine/threonine-protein kinase [Pyrinomonadaceae bacterium]|nr:serine/threonine-protein kinase [Pyrinomonadaceae bacterium]